MIEKQKTNLSANQVGKGTSFVLFYFFFKLLTVLQMPSIFSLYAPIHPTPTHPRWKGQFLNLIKGSCSKPIANIVFNGERLNVFPLRWRTRQECPLSPLLFNIILEILASATRQEKKNKSHTNQKRRNKTVPICIQHEKVYRTGLRWQAGLTQEEVFKFVHGGGESLVLGKGRPAQWMICTRLLWNFLEGGGGNSKDKLLGSP